MERRGDEQECGNNELETLKLEVRDIREHNGPI